MQLTPIQLTIIALKSLLFYDLIIFLKNILAIL